MKPRALALALALASTGCDLCTGSDPDGELEILEVDSDADLVSVERFYDEWVGTRSYSYIAAGTGGTVVVWGRDHSGDGSQVFVELHEVANVDLRAAFVGNSPALTTSWWAIGDAGTLVFSNDRGATWNIQTLADANLHAITEVDQRPLIVGDEIVLARQLDGSWTEAPPPVGGWGALRGVAWDGTRTYAVGLGGVAWSTDDPLGEWIAEPVGVEVDLLDVGVESDGVFVVGAQGTVLIRDPDGWRRLDTEIGVDLIDYTEHRALGADGGIYRIVGSGPLASAGNFAGALALAHGSGDTIVVGEGGLVTMPPASGCE